MLEAGRYRVVVLVDEYDKLILDNLTRPEVAREIRDGLRNLYSVIKDNDAHVKFAFLTGVSTFSKVSIFSGLNNLKDSVFYSHFAALGLDIVLEDSTHHGRIDMTLRFNGQLYLFEFKVVELEPEGNALQQIKDKGYADIFRLTASALSRQMLHQ